MSKSSKSAPAVIANSAVAPASETVTQTVVAVAKADKARAIFKEVFAQSPMPARKDIIARCMTEAGLTKAGAATYLQNYKAKNGLVVARTKAEPVTA